VTEFRQRARPKNDLRSMKLRQSDGGVAAPYLITPRADRLAGGRFSA